ncbi:hypothetical protein PFICI_12568 [Pestalotiopsis fici W106-1]|uniref:Alpha/beta hydrolase fold-3 domain-containing protein n=1 Tax=Pestalotiopsis fici (strain W106-1 / CGMCC3.15140) TaxID=1229662 RepID=W3WP91_PESFW|nr:uncharacterized protein PFICI_12568 [Pestalotiopsis fici W106-1]ETS75624.1 hypothetical protein PFICI_12568 [Pestalotiopsis fici W106-1]
MESWMWPQDFSLFQYLRFKAWFGFFRLLTVILDPFKMQTEARLIPHEVRREQVQIPSRDPGRSILGHMYYPPSYSTSSPAPVVINWHGSAFTIPAHGHDALFCARLARDAGVVVLDADYRKAPDHPFPAAPHDAEDALRWVAAQGGLDSQRIIVAGFSAGGNLALSMASAVRKKLSPLVHIPLVLSMYPMTDISFPSTDRTVPKPIKPLLPFFLDIICNCYCPNDSDKRNPLASPGLADAADFPALTAIMTAEGDTLRPEAELLLRKLEKNGRPVFSYMMKDAAHGFDKSAKKGTVQWAQREEMIELSVKLVKEAI